MISRAKTFSAIVLTLSLVALGEPKQKPPPPCDENSTEQACEAPLKIMPAEPRLPAPKRSNSSQTKPTKKAKASAKKGSPARNTTQVTK